MDNQNRRRIEGFLRKIMIDTCKPVKRDKNIEQIQFNNLFAEIKCKSFIKSNLARKKAVINLLAIFYRSFPSSNHLILLWTNKRSKKVGTGQRFVLYIEKFT